MHLRCNECVHRTDLVHILEGVDDIIRQTGQQVNHKPGFQVIHANEFRVRYHFPGRSHESGMKVQHNVHQKDHIHNAVHNQPGDVVLLGFERDVVGDHDGGVESENEDDPVPGGLKGTVVQDDVRGGLGGLLFVLRKDIWAQLENLQEREASDGRLPDLIDGERNDLSHV